MGDVDETPCGWPVMECARQSEIEALRAERDAALAEAERLRVWLKCIERSSLDFAKATDPALFEAVRCAHETTAHSARAALTAAPSPEGK